MFHTNQNALVKGLRWLQRQHCGYRDPKDPEKEVRCDCKYGIENGRSSEVNGCPELSSAATLLDALSPSEFQALIRRSRQREANSFKPSNKVFLDDRELHLNCPICRRTNIVVDDGRRNRKCEHCGNKLVLIKRKRDPKSKILKRMGA